MNVYVKCILMLRTIENMYTFQCSVGRETIEKNGLCIRVIGNLSLLPKDLQEVISQVVHMTKRHNRYIDVRNHFYNQLNNKEVSQCDWSIYSSLYCVYISLCCGR